MQNFLVLLSALLLSLAFHPLGLHFLAWVGLVPMLAAFDKTKPLAAFKSGILFGFFFSLFALFWLALLRFDLGITIRILMFFGLVLLFLYLGLYWGVAFLIARCIGIWFLPFILAGLEFLRGFGELGFPWLSLGYSQARYPVIIQQTSIYGIYGLSFWLALFNVSLYELAKKRKIKNLLLAVGIFFLPVVYGLFRLNFAGTQSPKDRKFIIVGIVQPNIDPNLKVTAEMRGQTFNTLLSLSSACIEQSLSLYGDSCDLIIWPEGATVIFLKSPSPYRDMVVEFSNTTDVPVLAGTPIYDYKRREIYNSAILIEPGNKMVQEYKKLHLVPFGEHIPYSRYIPLFRKIDLGEGDYSAGSEWTVFNINKLKFSCLVCFESIFPELSRTFVQNGAELLVNITNDGWFGKISGSQQHNDMAILRASENGVPLARSANTGISMVVDQLGRVLKETKLFQKDFITHRLSIAKHKTVYQSVGDALPIFSLILIPVILLRAILKPALFNRQAKPTSIPQADTSSLFPD